MDPFHREPPITADWTELAACKGRTALFFSPLAERPQARVRREAQARALCSGCPVREPCRRFARAHREYGFWGGESEEERHRAGFTLAAPIGVRSRAGNGGIRVAVVLDEEELGA